VSVCVVPASSACAVSSWLRTNTIQLRVPYVRCRERNAELQRAHRIVEHCVHQTQPNPTQAPPKRSQPHQSNPTEDFIAICGKRHSDNESIDDVSIRSPGSVPGGKNARLLFVLCGHAIGFVKLKKHWSNLGTN